MKDRVLYSVVGILVLIAGLIALGFYIYNLGAASAVDESVETPLRFWQYAPFHPVLGIVFAVVGFMILLRIIVPMILFPLIGIGFMSAKRRWHRGGPWHWHHMDWEDDVPPMVRSWHRHMHEMEEGEESASEE